jgi:hypothetical protein
VLPQPEHQRHGRELRHKERVTFADDKKPTYRRKEKINQCFNMEEQGVKMRAELHD